MATCVATCGQCESTITDAAENIHLALLCYPVGNNLEHSQYYSICPKSFGKNASLPLRRRMHCPTACASCSLYNAQRSVTGALRALRNVTEPLRKIQILPIINYTYAHGSGRRYTIMRDSIYAIVRICYGNSVCLSVRLSVCLSHGWISQKRLKLGSRNFHHTVAPSL